MLPFSSDWSQLFIVSVKGHQVSKDALGLRRGAERDPAGIYIIDKSLRYCIVEHIKTSYFILIVRGKNG